MFQASSTLMRVAAKDDAVMAHWLIPREADATLCNTVSRMPPLTYLLVRAATLAPAGTHDPGVLFWPHEPSANQRCRNVPVWEFIGQATARIPQTRPWTVAFSRTGLLDGSHQVGKCGLPIGLPLLSGQSWWGPGRRPRTERVPGESDRSVRFQSIA